MNMQLANQKVIELVILTYTSNSTNEIAEAFSILINNAFEIYPRSFTQLEDILAKRKYQIDENCRKAIVNLIKVTGMRMLDALSLLNKADDDVVNKHKRLLHTIQHILDNKQIQSSIKLPIIQIYIDLFLYFTPQNYQRLVSKGKYYFNTRQYYLAVGLIETYLSRKIALKYRFPYCEMNLELMVSESDKLVQMIVNSGRPMESLIMQILQRFFGMLQDLWNQMTFEKFETIYQKILTSPALLNLIINIHLPIFGDFWKKYFYNIFAIITISLGRCKLFDKYPQLMNIIRKSVIYQFEHYINGGKSEVSTLSLIAAAIQYKLIEVTLSSFDLFGKLIYRNYLSISKYIEAQSSNLPEVINFLNDATFYMESQVEELLSHKILYLLCKHYEQIGNSFKSLIYAFFCKHISTFGNGEVKQLTINVNLQEGLESWKLINQKISQDQQIEVVLLCSALSANFFISEVEFMKKMEEFTSENEIYLLQNPNKKIIFYSLLLYKNYMDDIFNTNTSGRFREKSVLFAISNQTDQIIKDFSLDIIKEKLSQKPTYDEFSSQINLIVKQMVKQYKEYLIPIITIIFRDFGEFINCEDAINIIKQTLAIWKEKQIFQDKKSNHLQLLKMFLNIHSCKDYYLFLIEELLSIANQNIRLIQRHIEQFLDLMAKGIQICQNLPKNFEQIVIKFDITVNNVTIMETINHLIMYSQQSCFFNWLAHMLTKNNLNVYEILLIHNLIYYGNKLLSEQSIKLIISSAYLQRIIKPNQFDYRNGKICLIFLFLLKYNWNETNHLLKDADWSYVIQKGKIALANMRIFAKYEQIGVKPFIEEIYDIIYKTENIYRWKYDIEMFLINQLDIFKYQISDQYQLMYANLSFIACTMNILRAYDFIQNHAIDDCSDSDESINPHSKIERLYRETEQIIKHFAIPPHLKEADYFTAYKKVVAQLKKDENSKKWVDTLFKAAFRGEHYTYFDEILKMQKNNEGNYRKISRIRRRVNEDQNDS